MRFCQLQHTRVELSEHDPQTIDRIDLWGEDGDLIDVPEETLIGILAIDVVEETFDRLAVKREWPAECHDNERGERMKEAFRHAVNVRIIDSVWRRSELSSVQQADYA